MMRRGIVAAVMVCLTAGPLAAQRSPADAAIDRAVAAFDAADIEGGAAMLQTLLASLSATDLGARARALTWIGAARWWTGEPDSARAAFRAAVEADPFVTADAVRLSPDVMDAYLTVRRAVPSLGIRFTADTTLRPDSAIWRVQVAVGRPGSVRLRLQGGGLDSTIATATVDSASNMAMTLTYADGTSLRAGDYRLSVEAMDGTNRIAARTMALNVERLHVDTTALVPLPTATDFKPETQRGGVSTPSMLRGVLLGAAAAVLPIAIAGSEVSSSTVQTGAAVVGVSIGIASIVGAFAGRPTVNIDANIEFNRNLRETAASRNRTIVATNDRAQRYAPLRLRAEVVP